MNRSRRPIRKKKLPIRLSDYICAAEEDYGENACKTGIIEKSNDHDTEGNLKDDTCDISFEDAMRKEWRKAIEDKVENVNQNNTWKIVKD